MKNYIVLMTSILLYSLQGMAADPSGLFEKSGHRGGFGGVSVSVYDGNRLVIGGEGAALMGNIYIGGFGHGADLGPRYSAATEKNFDVTNSLGGLMAGYFSNPGKVFSLFFETRIGFGEASARASISENIYEEYTTSMNSVNPNLGFVFMPFSFIQIRFFGGYNYTGKIDLIDINNDVFNGFIFGGTISFGKF